MSAFTILYCIDRKPAKSVSNIKMFLSRPLEFVKCDMFMGLLAHVLSFLLDYIYRCKKYGWSVLKRATPLDLLSCKTRHAIL